MIQDDLFSISSQYATQTDDEDKDSSHSNKVATQDVMKNLTQNVPQEVTQNVLQDVAQDVLQGSIQKPSQQKRVFIIDGYGQIYRSYFAFITNPLKDKNGNNVSAIFGFFNIIMMLIRQYSPDYLVVAMDSAGKTFRHEMYDKYKANRDKTPEDLHSQIPIIEHILDEMKIPHYAQIGMEADDIVATICRNASKNGIQSIMVTGDKDLLQLVKDDVFALRPPRKNEKEYKLCTSCDVKELFGVYPNQIVDYLTVLGDSSDNVPGIDGIGEKGAVKLLTSYGSLKNVYEHINELSKGVQQKLEVARPHLELSHNLITLKDDLFEMKKEDFSSYTIHEINWENGIKLFNDIGADRLAKAATKFVSKDVEISGNSNSKVPQNTSLFENTLELGYDNNSKNLFEQEEKPLVKAVKAQRGHYEAITDYKKLQELLSSIPNDTVVAFDLETTDQDDMKAIPVGFSFAFEEEKSFYVPLVCHEGSFISQKDAKNILSSNLKRFRIVGQNLKYDLKVLRRWGIEDVIPYADTMIMAWMDDSSSMRYNLDALAKKYLDYDTIKFEDVVPKGSLFSSVPLEQATQYGAEDSDITLRLFNLLSSKLKKENLLDTFFRLEMSLVNVLCDMELEGVLLDSNKLQDFGSDLENEIEEVQKTIFTFCNKEFNLNSPKQLQDVLFVDRKLPTGRKTQQGFSTDSAVLEELSFSTDDPVPPLLLRYRALTKLLNTYVLTLPTLINSQTGRIHTTFLQTGTATGRLSSKNPNLQNIPIRTNEGRRIRDAFVPKPGCILMSADYSQIELVVLSHISGDTNLRQAFLSGEDVHKATAAKIFDVFPEMVTSDQRRVAKTINFGIMYGMSAFRLSKDLKISRADALKFINTYFEEYSGVKTFIENVKIQAKVNGFVKTAMGHIRYIPEMKSRNKAVLASAERIAVNTIIQGTAAEIMKLAMISLSNSIKERNLQSKMLLQVHDEMIFEVPIQELDEMKSLVLTCMENAYKLSVPLKVGLETGNSWGEMH